ncbi:MAG: 6-carboxytetrahydropterin synthase QueD [Okeania sp. SIO2G4]|uniref:6-carboxytetrahydropterin synthase QueD n=1 Tax=unclassified Okeania TaxID=2634635 RepID=UPI0013B9A74C|nr:MULTISPECIES: 6-carboxytetrahydropterin synthase QueD [unclassified Okeania]NEP03391.1 6-carboxytetrahydropterin synthase QueD [Okeania sp. SIO4D6]NEP37926.1 6-carboxytetrahydropterin synthase QueD [Okeania sp. SIO2H7]NEP71112.1 6-carboxytetrahydropterin synthase QueD [Okeania sp. SIO2G5]NEP92026.1 6-carboxytetrahydropterin synthase QueD [Okeania sp. SIO2F5]NEQ90141.1 6-carboxytetrahydropterin synthase QueD [Okeania sp. SIO2G4]
MSSNQEEIPEIKKTESNSETWIIGKEFRFEASHQLPNHDGKCARLHGHSWRGVIYVSGNELVNSGGKQGMIMDYGDIKKHLKPLLDDYLDHYHLNETTGLVNPTSEAIAKWIYEQLENKIPGLVAVRIDETCTSQCIYSKGKSNFLIL